MTSKRSHVLVPFFALLLSLISPAPIEPTPASSLVPTPATPTPAPAAKSGPTAK